MTGRDIAHLRLANQQISRSAFKCPEDIVGWMGGIQAQDYAGAKWAIGCRTKGITDADVERLINEGKILRTHILRPTWHLVLPDDIHWMLKLTAPRIKALYKGYHQKLGIDQDLLKRGKTLIVRALDENRKMTRAELSLLLKKEKVNTADNRINFLLMDAELDGLICCTGKLGNQFAYTLLNEDASNAKLISRDEAIAALARRYFISRGPATARDFSWWSGLTLTDARKGIELNKELLTHEIVNGSQYWLSLNQEQTTPGENSVYLLPPFDEYAVAYKDRRDILDPAFNKETVFGLKPIIVSDGQITGTWKSTAKKDGISVETNLFDKADRHSPGALASVYKRYGEFMGNRIKVFNL
jgi:hypothetical protein